MLAYDRTGEGSPLVLLHGITGCRQNWDPLVPRLAASHDVLAIDLLGHGESPMTPPFDVVTQATAVHETLAATAIGTPLVVGHSFGAMVATAYAAMFDTRGVVNIDQPLLLGGFQDELRAIEPALRGDEAEFQAAMAGVVESLRGKLSDAEWARLESQTRADQEVVLDIWSVVLESPAEDLDHLIAGVASAIKVPYLALHGRDPGPEYAEWLTGLMPSAEVEVWSGLGHLPHLVQPDRFLELLAKFESSLPS